MILVFNESLDGHRLEYYHHLYSFAIKNNAEKYVFMAPESSKPQMIGLEWPSADNVILNFFVSKSKSRFRFVNSFRHYVDLKRAIRQFQPEKVVVMDLMAFMPFIPFLKTKGKISGIIYRIYLYTWKKDSIFRRIKDIITYFSLSRGKSINNIYVQNDQFGYKYLNSKYKTQKFKFLCDPVVLINKESSLDLRQKLKLESSSIIVLHPGGMSERKGTLSLLSGISNMSHEELKKFTWIFAGKVSPSIKEQFYSIIGELKEKTTIVVFDEFVDFTFLGSLFKTCDIIAIPYLDTTQSSGIVGYAAEYDKPVLVSKDGLLGKIVRRNKLGYLIKNTEPDSIAEFFRKYILDCTWKHNDNSYMQMNTIEEFSSTMLS